MVEQRNKKVELPRFKRSTSTWEGKVIEYLLAYPGKTAVELTGEALTSYFLVEALKGQVSNEEFQKACLAAAENLLKKLVSIQQMAGLNINTSVPSFGLPVAPPTQAINSQTPQQQEQEDYEDNWEMDIQLSEEMMEINRVLGGLD